ADPPAGFDVGLQTDRIDAEPTRLRQGRDPGHPAPDDEIIRPHSQVTSRTRHAVFTTATGWSDLVSARPPYDSTGGRQGRSSPWVRPSVTPLPAAHSVHPPAPRTPPRLGRRSYDVRQPRNRPGTAGRFYLGLRATRSAQSAPKRGE